MADRSVVYRIQADIGNLRAQMAQASASVRQLGNEVTSVGREGEKTRRGLDKVGNAAGALGLAAAAGLGAAVLKAANFDQAMSNVAAATHESAGNMELLRAAALKAGADTAFSATEAASAVEELSKAGVATTDILGGGLQGALDLAAAGALDVSEAAEVAASAMTQFGLSGQTVPHIADLLAAGAGKAQGSVHDLGEALNQSGLVASQVGLSLEDTTGALAAFASAGLTGSDAGTSFKTMLLQLNPTGKKAADEMDRLGLRAFDAQGKFIGLSQYAENLQSSLRGMSEEQRNSTLKIIFGNDAIRAANVLYTEGGRGIAEWTAKVNDSGFAAETAATRLDNLKGDLEQFSGSLETALIGTGSGSQGPLRSLVQNLTDVVNAYNKLPESGQSAVGAILGVTAVLGGATFAFTKSVKGIASTRQALEDLGPAGQKAGKGFAIATKGLGYLTAGLIAYNLAKDKFDIGVSDSENAQANALLDANAGPDIAAQIKATSDAIKSAQKEADEAFGVNLGVAKVFPFSQSAADAQDRVDSLQKHLKDLQFQQELNTAATEEQEKADLAAKQATDAYKSSHARLRTVLRYSADEIKAASKALDESKASANDAADGFLGLGDKVDKAKVSLSDWIKDLQKQANALRNFQKNAEEAGRKGVRQGLIDELKGLGPAGALRLKQLAGASPEDIAAANKAFKSQMDARADFVRSETEEEAAAFKAMQKANEKAAVHFVDVAKRAFNSAPKTISTELKLENRQALLGVKAVKRELADLREAAAKAIVIRTVHNDIRLGNPTFATGGAVRGPGSSTSDSIPAYLSNGEYVIKAAAVARYGVAMFDRLNAMRFAHGGFVGDGASGPAVDINALANLVAQARPLANQMTVMPHDYNEFRRQESQIRRGGTQDGWGGH